MPEIALYVLRDPRTKEVRYVGKTNDPKARLRLHNRTRWGVKGPYRNNWVKNLHAQGLRPVMEIVRWVSEQEWEQAERDLIAQYRASGARLTNMTDGGEGPAGHSPSEAHRKKIGDAHRGQIRPPEWRKRISAALKGKPRKPLSQERRAQVSASLRLRAKSGPRSPSPDPIRSARWAMRGDKPNSNSSSGVRGVSWDSTKQKWRARVTREGQRYTIGHFESIEMASEAIEAQTRKAR